MVTLRIHLMLFRSKKIITTKTSLMIGKKISAKREDSCEGSCFSLKEMSHELFVGGYL